MPDGTYLTERIFVAKRPSGVVTKSPGQAIRYAVEDLDAVATFLGLLDKHLEANCDGPEIQFWRESIDAKVQHVNDTAGQLARWFAPAFEEDDEEPGEPEGVTSSTDEED